MKILFLITIILIIAINEAQSAPNLAACAMKKDLFYESSYLKSVCIITDAFSYDAAQRACADNNMNLFIINDEEVEAQFYDAIMLFVASGIHARGTVWINGRREGQAMDFMVNDASGNSIGPLFSGVDFYSKYAAGNCLRFTGAYGPYQALPGACSSAGWATCEHSQKTESPPVLDTSKCGYKRDLKYDSMYIKSMCIIKTAYTYEEATRACSALKMNLFILDEKIIEQSLHRATEDIWTSLPGGSLWINGKRDFETNQWNTLNPDRTISGQISKDIEWVNKGAVHGKISGDCLLFSGEHGPYQALGADCSLKRWIICEYKN